LDSLEQAPRARRASASSSPARDRALSTSASGRRREPFARASSSSGSAFQRISEVPKRRPKRETARRGSMRDLSCVLLCGRRGSKHRRSSRRISVLEKIRSSWSPLRGASGSRASRAARAAPRDVARIRGLGPAVPTQRYRRHAQYQKVAAHDFSVGTVPTSRKVKIAVLRVVALGRAAKGEEQIYPKHTRRVEAAGAEPR